VITDNNYYDDTSIDSIVHRLKRPNERWLTSEIHDTMRTQQCCTGDTRNCLALYNA